MNTQNTNNQAVNTNFQEIEGFEGYFIDRNKSKVFKQQANGEMKAISYMTIGSVRKYRLSKNGERHSFTFEELIEKAQAKHTADFITFDQFIGEALKKRIEEKSEEKFEEVSVDVRDVVEETVEKKVSKIEATNAYKRAHEAAKAVKIVNLEEFQTEANDVKLIVKVTINKEDKTIKKEKVIMGKLFGKLSLDQVVEIYERANEAAAARATGEEFESQKTIAEDYGIHSSTVSEIKTGAMFGGYRTVLKAGKKFSAVK